MNEQLRLYVFAVLAGLGLLMAIVIGSRLRRKTPEQRERERRQSVNGTDEIQLLLYRYAVAGVSYEASQDITSLRHRVDLHSCRIGLITSVKYDPSNPGNSIVIAENWSGLRQ